jgi:four helix bundle protein
MQQELQHRTVRFAVAVYKFVRPMFRDADTRYIAEQLLRASTSLVANHRAAAASRSHEELAARLGVVRREADDAKFWLGFISETDVAPGRTVDLKRLSEEADELVRVLATPYRPGTPATPGADHPGQKETAAQPEAAPPTRLLGPK